MTRFDRFFVRWLSAMALIWPLAAKAATLPPDWQFHQRFEVVEPGLIKLSLPVQTLDRARPGLEDLRLYDDTGRDVAYVIERPRPAGRVSQGARAFRVVLTPASTIITVETGLTQALDGVTLESPAGSFIKSVQVEGSRDARAWQALAQGEPIFRQSGGASQLRVLVPQGEWPWLRFTLDDRRTGPIPVSGARVHAAAGEPGPKEEVAVTVGERHENPGETRLTLDLRSANLDLAALEIETPEPLFTRRVVLAAPRMVGDSIREESVGQGTVYRVAVEGQPVSANLVLPLETQVRSRQLVLLVRNLDSPPLTIGAVRVRRRPVYLVFMARAPGPYHLLSGNSRCAAPNYDLAALGANFSRAPVRSIVLSEPANNPGYRAPEVLPGLPADGAALDISAWAYRKPIQTDGAGVQQFELDMDVLAHSTPGLADLRLLRQGKQTPYILEHTSITRSLTPLVTATNDARDAKLSRWILKLPRAGLPVARLHCRTRTQLFQRELGLSETATDDRGQEYGRPLGTAHWVQIPEAPAKEFSLDLEVRPLGDTLFLETQNGDNPPIQLQEFEFYYPATRVLFKTSAGEQLFLHYGNPDVAPPRYDLNLVAGQLLAADRSTSTLGAETQLKKPGWSGDKVTGKGALVFWGILAVVVVVLLSVISKLLPKPPGLA